MPQTTVRDEGSDRDLSVARIPEAVGGFIDIEWLGSAGYDSPAHQRAMPLLDRFATIADRLWCKLSRRETAYLATSYRTLLIGPAESSAATDAFRHGEVNPPNIRLAISGYRDTAYDDVIVAVCLVYLFAEAIVNWRWPELSPGEKESRIESVIDAWRFPGDVFRRAGIQRPDPRGPQELIVFPGSPPVGSGPEDNVCVSDLLGPPPAPFIMFDHDRELEAVLNRNPDLMSGVNRILQYVWDRLPAADRDLLYPPCMALAAPDCEAIASWLGYGLATEPIFHIGLHGYTGSTLDDLVLATSVVYGLAGCYLIATESEPSGEIESQDSRLDPIVARWGFEDERAMRNGPLAPDTGNAIHLVGHPRIASLMESEADDARAAG